MVLAWRDLKSKPKVNHDDDVVAVIVVVVVMQ